MEKMKGIKCGMKLVCKKLYFNGAKIHAGETVTVSNIVMGIGTIVGIRIEYGEFQGRKFSWDIQPDIIWDHFYTMQEIRKLKIQKINEIYPD